MQISSLITARPALPEVAAPPADSRFCPPILDGLRVLVVERRPIVGGAVCTETMFGGYRMDIGSSAHIMIHLTPVVRELELEKFGLEYIDMDPFAFYPLPDGSGAIEFWRDIDKTCASIERIVSSQSAAAETNRSSRLASSRTSV